MRWTSLTLVASLAVGCADFEEALETERDPVSPPGIVQTDDIATDDTAVAGNGDGNDPNATNADPSVNHDDSAASTPDRQVRSDDAEQTDSRNDERENAQPSQTAPPAPIGPPQVVDLKKAQRENPRLKIVDQRVSGGDPFSQAASAYVSVRARASSFPLIRAVQLHKATTGEYPSFEEFQKLVKQNRYEFAPLPAHRMYAYDAEKGTIVVLEDPDRRAN